MEARIKRLSLSIDDDEELASNPREQDLKYQNFGSLFGTKISLIAHSW